MNYHHRFLVKAPQAAVADFHRHSNSMGAITPPPVVVRVHHAPAVLCEGDQMDFTMWLGPLPIHWVARIEQITPVSFVDRQLSGPFGAWEHLHTYVEVLAPPAPQSWGEKETTAAPQSWGEEETNATLNSWGEEQAPTTVVIDQVTAEFSRHWFWRLVGLGMWVSLPMLFAYRGWKTRRILETGAPVQARSAS